MRAFVVRPTSCLKGELKLPGDKSIAHRAVILSAISFGKTILENFPLSEDCLSTITVLKKLGIKINIKGIRVSVFGKGLYGLKPPSRAIFVGESATTFRLILGVLAGQNFRVRLTAGKSLSQRPMLRVTRPLRMMGALIKAKPKTQDSKIKEEYPPITIKGARLKGIVYKMPVASAQVKSAILLAGLYAKGKTMIIEPIKTRDHTERMLKLFKADLKVKGKAILISGKRPLISPRRIYLPGDLSSASFFLVAASILPEAQILIRNVNLNPTRTGLIRVLRRMGAKVKISRLKYQVCEFEPMADISVMHSVLKGTRVKKEEIPSLIDELPILMVAACFAKGMTVLEGVGELRVKETDRIRSMVENLRKMGASIEVRRTRHLENIIIKGVETLKGTRVSSFGDHRTAMSMIIAGLNAKGNTLIDDIGCIDKSFPEFPRLLKSLLISNHK
ncbi:MAG: 3-phosphoshikimate 1-carboxyvinyltransferase [Candidatus Omnitrophica bacterium]|nr:3-phosphoshikimate 1-carboxyvinyltransferase [Candidatus Omnitrophota bacterium]